MDLTEAKQIINDGIKNGVKCPCCNQVCKLYKRELARGMVLFLIALYKYQRQTGKEWVHYNDIAYKNSDYAKLRYWGLIKPRGDEPTQDTKSSGFWSITEKGKLFTLAQVKVPSHVIIFDVTKYGESETLTDIKIALGKKFSYSELMGEYLQPYETQKDWSQKQMFVKKLSEAGDVKLFEVTGTHDKKYRVELHHNAFYKCECEGYRFSSKKTCKHCVEAFKFVKREAAGIAEEAQGKLL